MHWRNHKTASISVKISQWDNSSHTEIMVIPKENLIAFLQKCHYIVKTQMPISTLLLFPQSSHMKKCHNNNWIHLALYSHKNISGNVGFWWHLRARKGWRKDEKWKRKIGWLNPMLLLLCCFPFPTDASWFMTLHKIIFPHDNKFSLTVIGMWSAEQIPGWWHWDMFNGSA